MLKFNLARLVTTCTIQDSGGKNAIPRRLNFEPYRNGVMECPQPEKAIYEALDHFSQRIKRAHASIEDGLNTIYSWIRASGGHYRVTAQENIELNQPLRPSKGR